MRSDIYTNPIAYRNYILDHIRYWTKSSHLYLLSLRKFIKANPFNGTVHNDYNTYYYLDIIICWTIGMVYVHESTG